MKHLYIFLGPPGSGKTTYSVFLSDFYGSLNRLSRYINLDCSNIQKHIINSIDFRRILLCEEIISELHMGPNSSIFFSIEYLCDNIEWLENEIESVIKKNRNNYFFVDLPGQMELFTHHNGLRGVIKKFNKNKFSITTLLLNDPFFWYDETNFHILALLNLLIIFNTEISFYHILTKIDLLLKYNLLNRVVRGRKWGKYKDEPENFSIWNLKLKYSLEDIIFDFGVMNPNPLNLSENKHLLSLVKNLDDNR